jgi:hypothetical protein
MRSSLTGRISALEARLRPPDAVLDSWRQGIYDLVVQACGADLGSLFREAIRSPEVHPQELAYPAHLIETKAPHAIIEAYLASWQTPDAPTPPGVTRYQAAVRDWWQAHSVHHEAAPLWRWRCQIRPVYGEECEGFLEVFAEAAEHLWPHIGDGQPWGTLTPEAREAACWDTLEAIAAVRQSWGDDAPEAEVWDIHDRTLAALWEEWRAATSRFWSWEEDHEVWPYQPGGGCGSDLGGTREDWRRHLGREWALELVREVRDDTA